MKSSDTYNLKSSGTCNLFTSRLLQSKSSDAYNFGHKSIFFSELPPRYSWNVKLRVTSKIPNGLLITFRYFHNLFS